MGQATETIMGRRKKKKNMAYLHLAERKLVGIQEYFRGVEKLRRELLDV